jgi:hypothetical protein
MYSVMVVGERTADASSETVERFPPPVAMKEVARRLLCV